MTSTSARDTAPEGGGTRRNSRKIIHLDMDAFYASVEQRDNPGCGAGLSPSAVRPLGAWLRLPATGPAHSAEDRLQNDA